VQLIAREEPKTKPKPLATLQVIVPTWTPCARAGWPIVKPPAAKPSAQIAIASFLSIPSTSWFQNSLGEAKNGGSYSVVPPPDAMVSLPAVLPTSLSSTLRFVAPEGPATN
jgi:hypothetical protein